MKLENIIKEGNKEIKRQRIKRRALKLFESLLVPAALFSATYGILDSSFVQNSLGDFYQNVPQASRVYNSKVDSPREHRNFYSVSIPSKKLEEKNYSQKDRVLQKASELEGKFSDRYSEKGKFLRTYRWRKIISEAEKKYDLPKGILAGIIMEESMGNPLELNSLADGGAGLMMFQPGTAREYGLKIYGNSDSTGIDRKYGKKLAYLVKKEKYNLRKLENIDERFNIYKSIFAGAKFLKKLHEKYNSWNEAISAYNHGTPLSRAGETNYVQKVKDYGEIYKRIVK